MADEVMDKKFAERREKISEQGRKEYEEVYKRMIEKLSPLHIEPLSEILLEKDGAPLNCALSIDTLKQKVLQELLQTWNENIWDFAADKLTHLEMLKESLEGKDVKSLNIKTKSAEERLLPCQMRYKMKRLKFLNMQIEHQAKIIEQKSAIAVDRRTLLRHVEADALVLNEAILNQTAQHDTQMQQMSKEFNKLLRGEEDGVFTAKPKVGEEF